MKTMPKTTSQEKYRWIKPIIDKQISIKNMTNVCPFCERSLKYRIANFKEHGIQGLENKSKRPKTHPDKTPIRIKETIIEMRKENKCCAIKMSWKLKKQGINLHHSTIGKIIKKEGLTRKNRVRKIKYKYVKDVLRIGDLVEIDIKYVPKTIEYKQYYQFTAVDCSTRWRYLEAYDDASSASAIKFLKNLIRIASFKLKAVKTDNGSCFTNRYTGYLKSSDPFNPRLHAFDLECRKSNIEHYLIDPGKPAQNGIVERSHRTDQEQFYNEITFNSFEELKYKLKLWNMHYNNLEHCGLNGLTPNEALRLQVQNVCV